MKARGKFIAGLLGAAALLFAAAPSQAGEFDGVTVNVMTQTGAIQEPLARRAPEFEKLTGAKINVIAVPFSDLYQKVLTDWASDDERAAFLAGLRDIDTRAGAMGSTRFAALPASKKVELMTALDAARGDKTGAGLAFARLKALTVYGYFTSQRVEQEILKVQMYFNGYQGNVPFTPAV